MENNKHKLKHRFDIVRKLGQGTYGKVQLAINKETGHEVAVKTIKKSKIETEQDAVRIRREIQIMSSIRHPNIIHIYEVFENRDKIVLVMQNASGGELYEFLSERKVLSDVEARRLFRQVVAAVYYIHKYKICHRDLKLENILLDEKGNAKIADFGLSNVYDEKNLLSTSCGSPLYASPEIVKGLPYFGPEVDCWSLGVLLYTLVYGAMPFDGSNFKKLVKQISNGDYYEPKRKAAASGLIRQLLTVNALERATIVDVCKDPWVNEGYETKLLQVAEDLANLSPVRLELLLALQPPPAMTSVPPSQAPPTAAEAVSPRPVAPAPTERCLSSDKQHDAVMSNGRHMPAEASADVVAVSDHRSLKDDDDDNPKGLSELPMETSEPCDDGVGGSGDGSGRRRPEMGSSLMRMPSVAVKASGSTSFAVGMASRSHSTAGALHSTSARSLASNAVGALSNDVSMASAVAVLDDDDDDDEGADIDPTASSHSFQAVIEQKSDKMGLEEDRQQQRPEVQQAAQHQQKQQLQQPHQQQKQRQWSEENIVQHVVQDDASNPRNACQQETRPYDDTMRLQPSRTETLQKATSSLSVNSIGCGALRAERNVSDDEPARSVSRASIELGVKSRSMQLGTKASLPRVSSSPTRLKMESQTALRSCSEGHADNLLHEGLQEGCIQGVDDRTAKASQEVHIVSKKLDTQKAKCDRDAEGSPQSLVWPSEARSKTTHGRLSPEGAPSDDSTKDREGSVITDRDGREGSVSRGLPMKSYKKFTFERSGNQVVVREKICKKEQLDGNRKIVIEKRITSKASSFDKATDGIEGLKIRSKGEDSSDEDDFDLHFDSSHGPMGLLNVMKFMDNDFRIRWQSHPIFQNVTRRPLPSASELLQSMQNNRRRLQSPSLIKMFIDRDFGSSSDSSTTSDAAAFRSAPPLTKGDGHHQHHHYYHYGNNHQRSQQHQQHPQQHHPSYRTQQQHHHHGHPAFSHVTSSLHSAPTVSSTSVPFDAHASYRRLHRGSSLDRSSMRLPHTPLSSAHHHQIDPMSSSSSSSSFFSGGREDSLYGASDGLVSSTGTSRKSPRYARTLSDRVLGEPVSTPHDDDDDISAGNAPYPPSATPPVTPRLHIRTQQGRPPVVHMELSFNGRPPGSIGLTHSWSNHGLWQQQQQQPSGSSSVTPLAAATPTRIEMRVHYAAPAAPPPPPPPAAPVGATAGGGSTPSRPPRPPGTPTSAGPTLVGSDRHPLAAHSLGRAAAPLAVEESVGERINRRSYYHRFSSVDRELYPRPTSTIWDQQVPPGLGGAGTGALWEAASPDRPLGASTRGLSKPPRKPFFQQTTTIHTTTTTSTSTTPRPAAALVKEVPPAAGSGAT